MKKPTVSVIMPVFNGERYLGVAIESILNQTYEDFEFIIINDGSTDTTESIILSFKDERIKYIRHSNSGIGNSLRLGCSIACGKYIARMDADDISFPDRLLVQVDFLEKHRDYILIGSAVNYINENGVFIGRSIPYITDFTIKYNLKYGCTIAHPTVMFLKEAYDKSHGYHKDIKLLEDYVLWLDMSKSGKYHNFHYPLLSYRQTLNSWYYQLNQMVLKNMISKFYHSIKDGNYENIAIFYNKLRYDLYYMSNNFPNEKNHTKKNLGYLGHWNESILCFVFYVLCQFKLAFFYLNIFNFITQEKSFK